MNWLAHTFLSTTHVEFRLGNLLADVVRGAERERLGAQFLRGTQVHQSIDAFTDSHAVVKRSRARMSAPYRRFSGVLIDVFYDYFLANAWQSYSVQTLGEFTSEFYDDVRTSTLALPIEADAMMGRIVRHDSLGSYVYVEGVERALRRISTYLSTRWRREFALDKSVMELREHEAAFAADFAEFFPQLRAHVLTQIASQRAPD